MKLPHTSRFRSAAPGPLASVALFAVAALMVLTALPVDASSHREAPFITEMPKVDATDFYAFVSYEQGREGFVTLIANYQPLQDPYGGPNYFTLDPDAEYAIHIDNTGDGIEDLSFVFDTQINFKGLTIPVGGVDVAIPLVQAGVIDNLGVVNRNENYQVYVVEGELGGVDRSLDQSRAASRAETPENLGVPAHFTNATRLINPKNNTPWFGKPIDNIGQKTFPDYERYARIHILDAEIPNCGMGRVFVGQRDDPFGVNLGETFDLINFNPVGPRDAETDDLEGKNVTTFALEIPIDCLTGDSPVIGAWTTARLPRERTLTNTPTFNDTAMTGGGLTQVSRLGMPLVNEVVIGLPDKNLFNASRPDGDAALATYVTNPTLPELIEILFGGAGVQAPNNFPRLDLVAAFATGIEGVNFLSDGAPHEMVRLNTSIPPTPRSQQNDLGVLAGDNAGFPNGRRPGDDVVDIELRVAMGALCVALPGTFGCDASDAPSGALPYTDGVLVNAFQMDDRFPYLRTPFPGSPSEARPD